MKLAEALILQSDMAKKADSLASRIHSNCKVQEGDSPSEDPQELLKDAFRILQDRATLLCRISRTNNSCKAGDLTIAEAITQRDLLTRRHAILKSTAQASRVSNTYGRQEVRWVPTMSASGLEKQADDIAVKIREINTAIQSANWTTDLVE